MSRNGPRMGGGSASGKRFVLLASQFNRSVTLQLIRGATALLRRHGASSRDIRLIWVPGAFELPVVAARIAASRRRPDAIVALGAVIRGGTSQYRVLAQAAAQGLSQVSVSTGVPVTFGIIVAESLAQAKARAGGAMGNRGEEAASAALEVLKVLDSLS